MPGTRFAVGTFAFGANEAPFPGIVLGARVLNLERHLPGDVTVRSLLADWSDSLPKLQELADWLAGEQEGIELSALRVLPPVVPCGQLFQAGANYRQHVAELLRAQPDGHGGGGGQDSQTVQEAIDARARTGRPYVFLGLPTAVVGADDDVVLPADGEQHDWELELAAVIGRAARNVSYEHALDFVAGYTICNDITTRDRVFRPDIQGIGTDWLAGKNRPTFLPMGPYLVPSVHVGDPMNLRITLRLNGQTMQDSSTADMLFDIARLIEYVSSLTELQPGDVLPTGSPPGNGVTHGRFLRPGDVMESEITGLGRQRNRCVAETKARASTGLIGAES